MLGLKKEVEAVSLPILDFILDIWTSKVSVDKYLGMLIVWAENTFSLLHAHIGISCGYMPYGPMRGMRNFWPICLAASRINC